MTSNLTTMTESGIHRSLLICCGLMALVFGAFGVSSFATAVGFSTEQTHLTIAGFVTVTGMLLVVVYRKQRPEKSPVDAGEAIETESQ